MMEGHSQLRSSPYEPVDVKLDAGERPDNSPIFKSSDALFLDVDGTLLEFAASPDAVSVPIDLVPVLRKLEIKLGGALAFVTGRRIEDVDRLFAPLRLPAAGVHGGELRIAPASRSPVRAVGREIPATLFSALARAAENFPGVMVEGKTYSLAIHYRYAAFLKAPLQSAIEAVLSHFPADNLEIMEGHRVLEIRMIGVDKGAAVRALMTTEPFSGRVPVFIGDDVTDEDGFAAARSLGGRAYSVSKRRGLATYAFSNPASVRDWLKAQAEKE